MICPVTTRIKTTYKPVIILIGGAWSAGKSTTAIRLAYQLKIANIVHTDVLRASLREFTKGEDGQCLSLATYETWRCESQTLSSQSLSNGFLRQCQLVLPPLKRCLQEAIEYGKDTIIEGLHLHPSLIQPIAEKMSAKYIWLTYSDSAYEGKVTDRCSSTYRGRDATRYLEVERAKKILMLNQLLIDAAQEHRVTTLDVTKGDPAVILLKMMSRLTNQKVVPWR